MRTDNSINRLQLVDHRHFILIISVFQVRCMMYGFGDDQCPYTESVDFLEDLVIEYITEMVGHEVLIVIF